MSLLIGLGMFVGCALALVVVAGVGLWISQSPVVWIVLGVAFFLALMNTLGAGVLAGGRPLPLWGWLPLVVTGVPFVSAFCMALMKGDWWDY